MITATIASLLFYSMYISNTLSKVIYPRSVCVIGDVQADYNQNRDPRILMGTYDKMDQSAIVLDEDIVNTSAPIYEHLNFGDTGEDAKQLYLFKLHNIHDYNGWALSETLPVKGSSIKVFLTCFQDSLFDCIVHKWYWGYNSYAFPIKSLKILGGDCAAGMCLRNLTIQLKPDNEINKGNPSPGDYSKLDGEFYLIWDSYTDRYQWINQRDPEMRWYYRHLTGPKETYNWVYSENTSDRVACAPGYVEMPLFCNTFVYAGSEGGEDGYVTYNPDLSNDTLGIPAWAATNNQIATTFELGVCGDTSSPTVEPTLEPTTGTTNTMEPTVLSLLCAYKGDNVTLNGTVFEACEFGYYGPGDVGRCLSNGEIGEWSDGCFQISFSDYFYDFDNDIWQVYTTEDVRGEATIALDGSNSLRFIPEDEALVGVIRSKQRINWPMRLRTVVEKRKNECNLWAVSLGVEWNKSSPFSARTSWACQGGDNSTQMSLYNHTSHVYDSRCWSDTGDDSMEVVFSIRDAGTAHGAVVTTDCASLKLQIYDILGQSPWEDAYLWFGSYGESEDQDLKDKITQTIVGRFHSMQYTQFYSDFDGLMTHIWDADLSTVTEDDNALLLAPGDVVIANNELFQFTIPFVIKLGLYRPEAGDGDDWSNGEYAHFVSIGGRMDGYVEGIQSGVIQIVWDGKKGVRLIYSGDNIYETGLQKKTASGEDYCNWKTYGTQDVMIYVDSGKITIIDELCNDFIMTAAHDLNRTTGVDINNMSLGFIRPDKYNSGHRIGFKYIEAYQLPIVYRGQIANENAESAVVADILDIYTYAAADDAWAAILVICGVVLICFIAYFIVAWKLKIFPFKAKPKIQNESNINMIVPRLQSVDESDKKEIELEINELEEENERNNLDYSLWREWDSKKVFIFIMNTVNDGSLKQYEENIKKEIFESEYTGKDLVEIEFYHIRSMGIKKISARNAVYKAIKKLIQNEFEPQMFEGIAPNAPTPYI